MKLNTYRNITTLVLLISSLIFITGCKSKKTIASSSTLESKSNKEVVNDVLNKELKFNTIYAKGNVEFKTGGSSKEFSTIFKIIKDDVLQASVRPFLGVEALSLTLTPDSIVILDRLNKNYVAESINNPEIITNFDFNFYNLQALLTNKLFIPGQKSLSEKDYDQFKITSTPELYMLQTKDKSDLLYSFAVDASDRIASTLIYSERKNITLQWSYNDFINDNNQIYPTSIETKVDIAKRRIDLNISYDKLEIDKQFKIETSIPSRYKKVSFMELVGSYMKMK